MNGDIDGFIAGTDRLRACSSRLGGTTVNSPMNPSYRYNDLDREEVIELLPRGVARALDVGCGRGGFGELLRRQRPGVEVWGIDSSAVAVAEAETRLSKAVVGDYPDAMPAGERFDVITFLDVLEHMVDPWDALAKTQDLLSDSGVVVASIPNSRHYGVSLSLAVGGRWTYTNSGLLDRTHLRFFTKSSMRQMFESCGYEVLLQKPISESRADSVKARVIRSILPKRLGEEFVSFQYGVVARPKVGYSPPTTRSAE